MRAHRTGRRRLRRMVAAVVAATTVLTAAQSAGADGPAPSPPCEGVPQITDVVGDGHHSSSDVLSAWLTEGSGHLQAVIEVRAGTFVPEHSDAEVNGSGFAFLFTLNGTTDYVRTRAAPDGSLTYDYGTYSPTGGYFDSLGATTGSVVHSAGAGTTTIDMPAAFALGPGAVLAAPFVLTYDGITDGVPGWVDHAPGGQEPDDPARGADYVVGSCDTSTIGGGIGGGQGAPGAGSVAGATTAVLLSAPSSIVGSGHALITGSVRPARAGVSVSIARSGISKTTSVVTTESDGSFAAVIALRETTDVQALAGSIHSDTKTIEVRSRTRIRLARAKHGAAMLRGRVTPALPGRALLLRPNSPTVIASRPVTGGAFAFRLHGRSGALQVVYVPADERAERSTSNTVRAR